MENKEKNFISAVVYVHDAEKTIGVFLEKLSELLQKNYEHAEIICVNDASADQSVQVIEDVGRKTSITISIITMSCFHGVEMAMNAGDDLAIGDFVFEFDEPVMDYECDEIMRVYHRSLEGYDIVSARPGGKEKLSSRMFYKVFNRYSGNNYRMHTERFRILSRRVINRINSMNKTIPYRKAIYAAAGLRSDAIVYEPIGTATYKKNVLEQEYRSGLAVDTLLLFTSFGYRFSIDMTVLMMVVTVLMLIYSVVIYLTSNPVAGWTTTILFLSAAFFGLFGILTIIIKYLQLLLDLVFKQKHYTFEGIEKIN